MNNVSQPKLESGGSTQPQTDLGKAILEGALNDESKDTAVELAEVGLDTLISEGVLKEVPILKTILAAHKTWTAIHDQLFLRKVASLIQASPKFTEQDRVSFTSEHLSDPKKAKRLGDAVVLILDKLDDLAKSAMLAKVFATLVRGKIDLETFRRLAAAIDIGFFEDLAAFATISHPTNDQMRALYPTLVRTGLTEMKGAAMPGEGGIRKITCDVSSLGITFKKCINDEPYQTEV